MATKATYTNEYGETMAMKFVSILTIEHSDIGTVYHMPDGRFYTRTEKEMDIINPETNEPLMASQYTLTILNTNERALIEAHING